MLQSQFGSCISALTSRVTGVHTAAALPVSLAGCPASWNLTSVLAEAEAGAGAGWWPHLRLYEVSYMCCTTDPLKLCKWNHHALVKFHSR